MGNSNKKDEKIEKEIDVMALLQDNASDESLGSITLKRNNDRKQDLPRGQMNRKKSGGIQKVTFDYQGKILKVRNKPPQVTAEAKQLLLHPNVLISRGRVETSSKNGDQSRQDEAILDKKSELIHQFGDDLDRRYIEKEL